MFNIINAILTALSSILYVFTWMFDYVIRFLYNICGNYTLSLVLFALISRLLMVPLDYRVKLMNKRVKLISDKLEKARIDGKGDSAAIYRNRCAVFDEEGIRSPSTGLVKFLRIYLMIGIVRVIYTPISSILMISDDVRSQAAEITMKLYEGTSKAGIYPADMTILDKVMSDPSAFAGLSENFLDKATAMNNSFTLFGVNLATLPTSVTDFSGWMLLVGCMPFIYSLMLFASTVYYAKKAKTKVKLNGYLMPLYILCFSATLPLGISFYWICGFIISLIISSALNWYLSDERVARIHEQKKKNFVPRKRHFNWFIDSTKYDLHKMMTTAFGGEIAATNSGEKVDSKQEDKSNEAVTVDENVAEESEKS